jgi:hypothetical protein
MSVHLKTEFDIDHETAPAIRRKLEWASREKLIRSFSCRPLAGEGDQLVSIEWWDPIDEPVMFSRAHDKRGTRSA